MLKLNNINKIFNESTADEKIALDRINLTLNVGDFVTVIGSNGAGKSTMLNMVSG
ncbi:ATP-binding cassette domain-containing protein, partial [Psychrobacillus psychrotolerans]